MNIYKQTGKAAVLLGLFHLKSSQFKKWLKDGRSLMKRPKILKKRNESIWSSYWTMSNPTTCRLIVLPNIISVHKGKSCVLSCMQQSQKQDSTHWLWDRVLHPSISGWSSSDQRQHLAAQDSAEMRWCLTQGEKLLLLSCIHPLRAQIPIFQLTGQ